MANRLSDEKIQAIATEYCTNGFEKVKALLTMGYSKSYANNVGLKIFDNDRVKTAIKTKTKRLQAKSGHNYDTAIAELDEIKSNLALQAKNGSVQANSALIAVNREKSDISGLHIKHFVDDTEQQRELSEAEEAEGRRLAGLRLRKGA